MLIQEQKLEISPLWQTAKKEAKIYIFVNKMGKDVEITIMIEVKGILKISDVKLRGLD